jgi:hypothetical protein
MCRCQCIARVEAKTIHERGCWKKENIAVPPLNFPVGVSILNLRIHVDHPQKWGFWIHHRRSAEATLHPADRQPCGYKPIHQRGAIACPCYQSLRNRVGYFGRTGEILGLGFGSFFLCLVVCLFFVVVVTCSRLSLCLFFGFIASCSHSLFFY